MSGRKYNFIHQKEHKRNLVVSLQSTSFSHKEVSELLRERDALKVALVEQRKAASNWLKRAINSMETNNPLKAMLLAEADSLKSACIAQLETEMDRAAANELDFQSKLTLNA